MAFSKVLTVTCVLIFLTGVTKFAQVSVFSDLNQLNDISLDYNYATLCGITHQELTANLRPELEQLGQMQSLTWEETVEMMVKQYDGYHFHRTGRECLILSVR